MVKISVSLGRRALEGPVVGPLNGVTRGEVEGALRGMKNGKAARPSGMTSNLPKFAGAMGVWELLRVGCPPGNYGRGTCPR